MGKSKDMIKYCGRKWKKKTLIATATEGWIRYEWAHARFGQIIPMNWEASGYDLNYTAMGYSIDDAYNVIVKKAIELDVEWVIMIEDDVLLPPDTFTKFEQYQRKGDVPIVSGLYYLKASPTLPLVFRGRGNGAYTDFKVGQKVWCDGYGMGCLLINAKILKWFWERSEEYQCADGTVTRRVFETPQKVFFDPEAGGYGRMCGTQDLFFYDKCIDFKVFKECGWPAIQRKKWPLLCDTSIFCRHIDRKSGKQYP